jgi:hypothetical protein
VRRTEPAAHLLGRLLLVRRIARGRAVVAGLQAEAGEGAKQGQGWIITSVGLHLHAAEL